MAIISITTNQNNDYIKIIKRFHSEDGLPDIMEIYLSGKDECIIESLSGARRVVFKIDVDTLKQISLVIANIISKS